MKKFLEGIKYWGQLLLLPIYWFSFLFPRNKNIWLFGSTFGRRFADNPRRLSDEKPSHYVLTTSEFMKPGDIQTVLRGEKHAFTSHTGAIFEEVSTTHVKGDSYYDEPQIRKMDPMERKTILKKWQFERNVAMATADDVSNEKAYNAV